MNNLQKEQMKATPEALRKKNYIRKEQVKTSNEIFIESYLRFKAKCFDKFRMSDLNEIIKLFEVWTRTCS